MGWRPRRRCSGERGVHQTQDGSDHLIWHGWDHVAGFFASYGTRRGCVSCDVSGHGLRIVLGTYLTQRRRIVKRAVVAAVSGEFGDREWLVEQRYRAVLEV